VPFERQGRVFGFAQTVENAASPLTSFMIGPLAQLAVIPFMSDGGAGADLIGGWFGTGRERGIALIFTIAGLVGVAATFAARASKWYAKLSALTDGPSTPADDAAAGEPEPQPVSSG
jgi:DHA3 family multidrug efflux protein-like MFS transporter